MPTLRRMLGLLVGHRAALMVGIACAVVYTLLALIPPLLLRAIIQDISQRGSGPEGNSSELASTIAILAGGVAVVAVARGILRYSDAIISHIVAYRILDRLLMRVYAHLQTLPHHFFVNQRTGALATRAVADVEAIEVFIAHAIGQSVQAFLVPMAMVAVLFAINPQLTLLAIAPLPLVVGVALWFQPRFTRFWRRVRHQLAELGATFHEDVGGMAVIKSFAREPERRAAMQRQSSRFRDEIIWANRWSLVPVSTIESLGGIALALVLWQGGLGALAGHVAPADLFVFVLYIGYIYQPLLQLSALSEGLNVAIASGERVFELIDTPADVVDAPTAFVPHAPRASVTFERVTFGYDAARPILRSFDLSIQAGETVALVGQTGAGKTTTINLIPRFYDVQGGSIRVGDHDVRELRLAWLRSQVSMVLQDVFLFHGTIRDNLLFGRPEATEAEIRAAAHSANADEFIEPMPQGYDTLIGERGVRLSGGQKQRLSIARAVLKDAPILILDEATSSVDVETESFIQEALTRLTAGRTTIVIAHRLSTIRHADRIAVLEHGQIAEIGDHDHLLNLHGTYARLYQSQVTRNEWGFGGLPSAVVVTAPEG